MYTVVLRRLFDAGIFEEHSLGLDDITDNVYIMFATFLYAYNQLD